MGLHCMVQHKHEAIFDNFEFLQSLEKGNGKLKQTVDVECTCL